MLNYHDTKKGSLFWISKIKWYVIYTITIFHSNNYSIIKFTLKPFTVIH